MGPRLFSRGNVRAEDGVYVRRHASMGPRLFSRGNVEDAHHLSAGVILLQWGHGFSAVEIGSNALGAYMESMLQWGHGFSAVEIGWSWHGRLTMP